MLGMVSIGLFTTTLLIDGGEYCRIIIPIGVFPVYRKIRNWFSRNFKESQTDLNCSKKDWDLGTEKKRIY